ncbi:hypothetical protein LXD69_07170 [Flavobacterium sediminilitoris]|uniref:Uncharacterized protein n=1 Tax=Flavobacterium sediminilitoris TaxID=2024526 RepID=A0ABY4HQW1_9FLAO|nr:MULTISPECIES: hypothetical protein [Flavobacterium]UOX35291.1 hypothetical protein LXD69_07170 [Flavobacterium sediminilitoris]
MSKFEQKWDFTYDNKPLNPYNAKNSRSFIIALTIGALIGSIITAILLMTYSVFFL